MVNSFEILIGLNPAWIANGVSWNDVAYTRKVTKIQERRLSADFADYTDFKKRNSHEKAQNAQKEIS
jgi:hypothetical protein